MNENYKKLRERFNDFFERTDGKSYNDLNAEEKKEFDSIKEDEEFLMEYERDKQSYYDFEDIHDIQEVE